MRKVPSLVKVVLKTILAMTLFFISFDFALLGVDRLVVESRVQKLMRDIEETAARNNGIPYEMITVFQEQIDSIEERSFLLRDDSIQHNMTQTLTARGSACPAEICDTIGFYGDAQTSTARVYEYGEWMDVALTIKYRWNGLLISFLGNTKTNTSSSSPSLDEVVYTDRDDFAFVTEDVKHSKVNAMRLLK